MSHRNDPHAEPLRTQVDAWPGLSLLEFGAPWCGHCIAARPVIETAAARVPALRHVRIEDGRGRPLGRSFAVKLWPTLVVLRDGIEVARVVRPRTVAEVAQALDAAQS